MGKTTMLVLAGFAMALRAAAQPALSGTPDELAAHLRSLPGQATLAAEAERRVEADRAEVVLGLRSAERSFKTALLRNQRRRAEMLATLEKSGIPAERVRVSRFSTMPVQSRFLSSKVKSYEIESRVTVEAASEKEVQAVAAVVDEADDVSLLSLTFDNTRKEEIAAQVLQQALAKIGKLRQAYENELGVTLVPRSVGAPAMPPMPTSACAGKNVSGLSLPPPDGKLVLHALAAHGPEQDISQFDQVVYKAAVTVTFDVVPRDR